MATTKPKKKAQPEPQGILQQYAAKMLRKRELEAEVKGLNAELENLETLALDELRDRGEQSVKLASGATVYQARDIRASLVDDSSGTKNGAYAALKKAGMGYLVNPYVHPSSLAAYVRERMENGKELPPSVQKWVNVHDTPKVKVRRGG